MTYIDDFFAADAECRLARLERLCREQDTDMLRDLYSADPSVVEDSLCDLLDVDVLTLSQYGLHGIKAGEDDDWRMLMPS